MGADLITISTDTHYTHLAWARAEKELKDVKYPMGSDASGKISRLFGVFDEDSGLALRGTFLVKPDGTLVSAEVNFYNLSRNIDELMRKFKASVYMSRKTNEVCPSKWRDEGDRTLIDPGAKMVGRVHEALHEQHLVGAEK